MTDILIATNWNNTAGFAVLPTIYTARVPQYRPGRINVVGDGSRQIDGFWLTALVFDAIKQGDVDLLMTALGFTDAMTEQAKKITVYLPDRLREWRAWNAWADWPAEAYVMKRFQPLTVPLRLVQEVSYP